jgi:hypothetical protein
MAVRLADLTNVPMTMAEVEAMRRGRPIDKGKTRLELKVEAKPLTKIDEKDFKKQVWNRDQKRCRCCGRKVIKTIERVPERGEVNHIHGRTGDLRYEVRAAILMCLACHERFTGRVNKHRLRIVASKTFTIRQGTFTDATFPVKFEEAA